MRTEETARPARKAPTRSGARRSRLNSRRQHRSYGRFLGFAALGSFVPGSGLLAAGRRRSGLFFLTLFVLGVAALAAVYLLVPKERLLAVAFDQRDLTIVAGVLAAVGIVWLLIAVVSHRALEPAGLSAGKRLGGAFVVIIATSLVLTPVAAGVQRAFVQRDLIESVAAPENSISNTTPETVEEVDPWADKPRVNVLLLGGDGGPNREGIRPDSQILASIDTQNGDTVLFSLPRNLQHTPFPEDSPLHVLPRRFRRRQHDQRCVRDRAGGIPRGLRGRCLSRCRRQQMGGRRALGVDVDYFVMLNLGFEQMVDALGGITIDVKEDIPIGGGSSPISGYIQAGKPAAGRLLRALVCALA